MTVNLSADFPGKFGGHLMLPVMPTEVYNSVEPLVAC